MASKAFSKDTKEREMFVEFWEMCQKYWIPEDSDEYWQTIIKATDDFVEKYKDVHPIVSEMACAFVSGMEKKYKEINNG